MTKNLQAPAKALGTGYHIADRFKESFLVT